MDVIVIGAGASGIVASLKASEKANVLLIEKNDKCAKKILITGNGKCNYWNKFINSSKYNTDNKEVLDSILNKKEETYEFLCSLGIYPKIINDYYYPHSLTSASIKEIFERNLKKKVKIMYNSNVLDISKVNDKFIVTTDEKKYMCDKIILATGSKAAPKTGSTGDSYKFLNSFNLKINPVLPALVQLKANGLKEISGLRVEASLKLFIDNEFIKETKGELQITDYGISGICTFNLSNIASISLNKNKKVKVFINFFEQDFKSFIENYKLDLTLEEALESIFNYKLMYLFFKKANVDKDKKIKNLTLDEKDRLSNIINNFELEITETNDFDSAQVCTGGLSLNEVNPKTLETKIKGLYVVGETLDVDGECGGFNLAFAFITGYIAGSEIDA